jgi:2-oxoglutarate dehydrogenase E2 component (dihydrolipoamide succinyltransferase)
MHEIRVPKLNNNDDTYLVLEWYADDGAAVRADDPLVSIETSKAIEEISAPGDGVVRQLRGAAQECAPGDLIATVSAASEAAGPAPAAAAPAPAAAGDPGTVPGAPADRGPADGAPAAAAPTLTAAAARHAEEHGISAEAIARLGRRVVRVRDLAALAPGDPDLGAAGPPASELTPAPAPAPAPELTLAPEPAPAPASAPRGPRGQGGVARTVTAAAQIPAAYSLAHLNADPYRAMAQDLAAAGRAVPGTLETLLKIIGTLYGRHPALFVDGDPPGADAVGVTVDVGRGLYVPVVRDAASLPVEGISAQLARHADTARSGRFASAELRGARISVSVTAYSGVVLTIPLIHPDQVAMLSLGMLTSQVTMSGGVPRESAVLPLGIAYDHRAVNGRDAIVFLRAIGSRFADQGFLAQLASGQRAVPSTAGTSRPRESRQIQ